MKIYTDLLIKTYLIINASGAIRLKGDNFTVGKVGNITKKWSGLLKETFTDSDNFGITFPSDANTNQKSILLGAVFLIDFVHFENH